MIKSKKFYPFYFLITVFIFVCFASAKKQNISDLNSIVQKRDLKFEVHTLGELEAAKSTIITSRLTGDLAKVIYLIEDGISVKRGDLLAKIDSTAYQDRIDDLKLKVKDQKNLIASLQKGLEWEVHQKEVEKNMARSDLFLAQLEYDKIIKHEAPQEEKQLKGAIEKSKGKINSLNNFCKELEALAEEGYFNDYEMKQTLGRIRDEKDNLQNAKEKYLTFTETTFPMQKHKCQTQLKRAESKVTDIEELCNIKIYKAEISLQQAKIYLDDLKATLRLAYEELAQTELKAPTDGMVILKEDFRSGQRRKPRIGDTLFKNQPLLDLPDLSSIIVKTRVREVDLHKIQIGKEATIQVDAFPDLIFTGEVTQIGVLAIKDPLRTGDEKFFNIQLTLKEQNSCLRPGMTARVTIHSKALENAITIPYQALFEDDHHSKYCFVQNKRSLEKRNIEIGAIDSHWVVVTSGLKEGERVCLIPPHHAHL